MEAQVEQVRSANEVAWKDLVTASQKAFAIEELSPGAASPRMTLAEIRSGRERFAGA